MSLLDAELVGSIYAAAVNPLAWNDVVRLIHQRFPGTKVVLNSEDTRARANIGLIQHGFDEKVLSDYAEHYCQVNPWIPFVATVPLLKPIVSDKMYPSSAFRNSEFWDGFIRPGVEIESAAAVKLFHENERFAILNLHYGTRVADTYNRTAERFLRAVAPHLRNAIEINRRLADPLVATPTIKALMDANPKPMFLIDGTGRLRLTNPAGERVLRERRVVGVAAFDRLVPADSAIAAKLDVLRNARNANLSLGPGMRDRHGWLWFVIRLEGGSHQVKFAWLIASGTPLLLILREPTRGEQSSYMKLRQRFGLTQAEALLALRLATGRQLRSAATDLSISYETARSELKSIFQKMGVHRQGELVALLANVNTPGEDETD